MIVNRAAWIFFLILIGTSQLDASAGNRPMMADISFQTVEGQSKKISTLKNKKALVVVMRSFGCPISDRLGPRLAQIESDYASKGVAFLFVYANKLPSKDQIKNEKSRLKIQGDVLVDDDGAWAQLLKATTTTEAFVFNEQRELVYRGAVDDQYHILESKMAVGNPYLRNVLDELVAGRNPAFTQTPAPGCTLTPSQGRRVAKLPPPNFYKHVQPLLQRHCQNCHNPEGSSFPLITYQQALERKDMIEYTLIKKLMPPWFVDEKNGPWKGSLAMPDEDRNVFLDWVAGGAVEGNKKDARPEKNFSRAIWALGKPDATVTLPKPVDVPADGFMPYTYHKVKTNFTGDRWVKSFEVKVKPRVVHHVVFHILKDGASDKDFWFNSAATFDWGVGRQPQAYPAETGVKIPAGATIGITVHYQPNGTRTTDDETRIGFRFHEKPPKFEYSDYLMNKDDIKIPPGAENYELKDEYVVPEDRDLLGLSTHMHLRGKASHIEVVYPDGTKKDLFRLDRYNFNFQFHYTYETPVKIPAGSKIICRNWYDNSKNNLSNPDPKQAVAWGDQVNNEMFICNLLWRRVIKEQNIPR